MDQFLIFDCDGVLVDSEILAIDAMLNALRPLGFDKGVDYWSKTYSGQLSEDIIVSLKQVHGLALPDDFYEETQRDMRQSFAERLQPISGMPELIRSLPQAHAVVSNSDLAHVKSSVHLAGLGEVFGNRIFSAEQVSRPKPAPDLYQYAIQQLQLKQEAVWVIEDSITGVTAAVAAGLQVIGFLGASHISEGHAEKVLAAGALHTAADADDLERLLKELGINGTR